jgi:hypothetical protein
MRQYRSSGSQEVSRCLLTATSRARTHVRSCGIYGEQRDSLACFLWVLRSPFNHSTDWPTLIIIRAGEIDWCAKWTQSPPPPSSPYGLELLIDSSHWTLKSNLHCESYYCNTPNIFKLYFSCIWAFRCVKWIRIRWPVPGISRYSELLRDGRPYFDFR